MLSRSFLLFVFFLLGGCAADASSNKARELELDGSWPLSDAGSAKPGDGGSRDAESRSAPDAARPHDAGLDAGPDGSLQAGFCPDTSWSSPGTAVPCEREADCPQPGSFSFACVLETPAQCGGVAPPPPECDVDTDCAAGLMCEKGCRTRCVAGCSLDSCGPFAQCTHGRCVASVRCDGQSTFVCRPTTVCSPGAAGADAFGCAPIACTATRDCPCGSCVNGQCAPHPGFCYHAISVP
ncbi:MAG: Tryptophan synthase alpha chain [Myxococcaceae bacterium]|nr:Tryptophan synthase alpha chain [Myxococcaceae bacterium]